MNTPEPKPHDNETCRVPFCKHCLANIKRLAGVARAMRAPEPTDTEGLKLGGLGTPGTARNLETTKTVTPVEPSKIEQGIRQAHYDLDKLIAGSSQDALRKLKLPSSFDIKSSSESYDKGWVTGFRRCLAEFQRQMGKLDKEQK